MPYLGLDVSTTKVGIAITNDTEEILFNDVIKYKKDLTLETKASILQDELERLSKEYDITNVFVEQPLISFKGGGQAFTTAILQRFNGMTCYACHLVFGEPPKLIDAIKARSTLGIKIVKKRGKTPHQRKQPIINFITEKYTNTSTPFLYELTHKGNPKPGTDDKADALVMALAGKKIA